MTQHPTTRTDISLPVLIEYINALLPSLGVSSDVNQKTPASTAHLPADTDDTDAMLWVTEDKAAHAALQAQLQEHRGHHSDKDPSTASMDAATTHAHVSTLAALSGHTRRTRYQLACFWLPTLSAERLQEYVPLLMRYRDLYAAHLLIALDPQIDLRAYGFTPFDILNEQALEDAPSDTKDPAVPAAPSVASARLWQFNLYDYKQLPNWLNADYWANPENWDKHRW